MHHSIPFAPLLVSLAFTALAACDEGGGDDGGGDPAPAAIAGYHETLRGVVETQCTGCHRPGGIGPFSMVYDPTEWAAGPPSWAAAAVRSVEQGTMPPWSPNSDCRTYKDQRVLAPAEKAAFTAWAANGYAAGDPDKFVVAQAQTVSPEPPSIELRPANAYTPKVDRPDDYRCLPLANTFDADTWVVGTNVVPDQPGLVHHVIVFLIPPDDVAAMEANDADDEGPGYTCFGDSGVATAKFLAIWAPGIGQQRTPLGSAFEIPAGSRLVIQVHYNVLNLAGAEPPADRSRVELWTLPGDERPERRLTMVPFADIWFDVPAGETVRWPTQFEVPVDSKIVAVAPHMHKLGTSISLTLARTGAGEECLVDIPKWDFNWHDLYWLPYDQALDVKAGDRLNGHCTYDNSPGAQPVVNGERTPPRDLSWGDGTADEMCLNFVVFETPVDTPVNQCAPAIQCARACPEGDARCFLECSLSGGADCATCVIPEWVACGIGDCLPQVQGLLDCLGDSGCADDSCRIKGCIADADAVYACNAGKMFAGECNGALGRCGLEF